MKIVSPGGLVYDVVLISTGIALQFALRLLPRMAAKDRLG